jgi:hypothetical protein
MVIEGALRVNALRFAAIGGLAGCFTMACLACPASLAATIRLSTDPSLGPATLQEAVDEAESGDTILIPAGRWPGALNVDGKLLTIVGESGRGTARLILGCTDNMIFNNSPVGTLISETTIESTCIRPPDPAYANVANFVASGGSMRLDGVVFSSGAIQIDTNGDFEPLMEGRLELEDVTIHGVESSAVLSPSAQDTRGRGNRSAPPRVSSMFVGRA